MFGTLEGPNEGICTFPEMLDATLDAMLALAPDLTLVEMEDINTVDWSEDCDDFAEDFVDIKRVKKNKNKNSTHLYMIQPDPNELFFFIVPDAIAW